VKVAYAVNETLELLSIGRTSLYATVKRGELNLVMFGKKTLFCVANLAAFLTRLRRLSEPRCRRSAADARSVTGEQPRARE